MTRALLMMVWGWTLIWSWGSGRLDLLLRGVFHGLVGVAGLVMLALGVLLLIQRRAQRDRRWQAIASASMAVTILMLPPQPSFSDLAGNRLKDTGDTEPAFVRHRTAHLDQWVRVLASQSDPRLVDGNPVNISGFVWAQADGPPLLARLTVRCCLADATPPRTAGGLA